MSKNTGIKVTLIVLVIICLIQGGAITSLTSQLEEMEYRLDSIERHARNTENALAEIKAVQQDNSLGEAEIDIIGADFASGKVQFKFIITPYNMSENTRVMVNNTVETVELEKKGSVYEGVLNFPMDTENYRTEYYVYEGEYERGSEFIDFISSGYWASKMAYAGFEGMTAYGNGKLTIAGDIDYYLNTEEKLESSRLVFADNSVDLKNIKENRIEINFSEKIESDEKEKIREIYLEFVTESGYVYQIYPAINAGLTYELQGGGEDKSASLWQEEELSVITDEGKSYHMSLAW